MGHRPRRLWAPRQAATSGHAQSRWRGFLLRLLSVFTDIRTYVPGPCRGFLSAPEGTERGRLPEMGHGVPGRDRRGAASDSQEDRRLWARRPTAQAREHGAAPPRRLGAPSAGGLGRRMSVPRGWSGPGRRPSLPRSPRGGAVWKASQGSQGSGRRRVKGAVRRAGSSTPGAAPRCLCRWLGVLLLPPSPPPVSRADRYVQGPRAVSLEAPLRSCHRLKLL